MTKFSKTSEPIAVVGTACRFPGGCNTPSKLWDLVCSSRDVLQKVPPARFNVDSFYHSDPTHHGTTNVTQSYFLDEDVTKFDNGFFGIQPMEAEAMDPQQRLLLETVYDSVVDAGLWVRPGVFEEIVTDDMQGDGGLERLRCKFKKRRYRSYFRLQN